jgi:hypothetical protein
VTTWTRETIDTMNFYIYFLRRPDKVDPFDSTKSQPFYIGKGCNGRYLEHRREAFNLLHKPGRKGYKIAIIHKLWKQGIDIEEDIIFDNLSEQQALDLEIAFIKQYGRIDLGLGCLTNLTDGGDGVSGYIPSKETIEKLSKSLKGREAWNKGLAGHLSEETIQKLRNSHIGHIPSEKTRKKMSESQTGRVHSEGTKRKMSIAKKGKPLWSPEDKKRIGESNKRRVVSEETKRRQSEAQKGKILTEEHKRKISESQKGREVPEDRKEKISQAKKGKPWTEGRREAQKRRRAG